MLIYLIYGPTCSGKTDLGIQIARETGWPVIALDRVQCCPQIATGSGRPLEAELQSTQRIYLDSRPLAEGVIETEAAHLQLISEVEDRKSSPGLILEGGSISLLNCMANSSYWNAGFRWQVSRLRLTTPDVFLSRASRRVTEMFAIRDERPSLLEELADLWNQNAVRPILEDIAGYRCAIRFAKEHNIAISELLHLDPLRQQALIAAIADEYLEYARWQERDFPDWREDDCSSGGFTLAACGEVNLVNQRRCVMNIAMDVPSEMVILCNVHGEAIGTAPKSEIHHAQTPLHLAFSVYIFNAENKLLVTRRALDKITWPGVLTNSCCGHPRPGEPLTEAVERRAREELGIDVDGIRLVLPEFSYCATMENGITEHELCPVFTARCQTLSVTPDLSEVSAWEWVDWQWFLGSVQGGRLTVSPWCRAQVELLEALGADPSQWSTADDLRLPEAARVSIQEVGPTAAHCTGMGT